MARHNLNEARLQDTILIFAACAHDVHCHCKQDCEPLKNTCSTTPPCCTGYTCPRGYFVNARGSCELPSIGCGKKWYEKAIISGKHGNIDISAFCGHLLRQTIKLLL